MQKKFSSRKIVFDDQTKLWIAFIVVGLATTLPRSSFLVLPKKYQPTQHFYAALKYAPLAALIAIIIPDIIYSSNAIQVTNPKIFAAIAAAFTILLSKNPWLPFITGITTLVFLQKT